MNKTEIAIKLPPDAKDVTVKVVSDTHTSIEYNTGTNPKGRIYHEILGSWSMKSNENAFLTIVNNDEVIT